MIFSCTKNEVLRFPLKTEVSTIDPHNSYDIISNSITYQVYDTLFSYEYLKRPYTITPVLAEKIPESKDGGKSYLIKIKKNIPYHPKKFLEKDRYVTAQDFITSLKRLAYQPTKSRGWYLYQEKIVGLDEFRHLAKSMDDLKKLSVEGLKAIDKNTLEVTLVKPMGPSQFLSLFTLIFTCPLPVEAITYLNNDLTTETLGTGAYEIESIDPFEKIVLKAFSGYNTVRYPTTGDRYANEFGFLEDADKALPLIPKIEFYVIKDTQLRWEKLLKGELDFSDLPAPLFDKILDLNGQLKKPFSEMNLAVTTSASLAYWWIEFNMNDPVVGKNKKLRQALSYGLNIEEYIKIYTNNTDQRANSLYIPGIFGYNPSSEPPYKYDLEHAKKLLKEAVGNKKIELTFETRRDSDQHIQMAEFIKKNLSEMGIKLNYKINTFSEFLEKSKNGKMQFWHGGWLMDYPDPENILQLLYSQNANGKGPNKSNYQNPMFDTLVEKYQKSNDEAEKLVILAQIEEIVFSDLPWIMLNYSKNYNIYNKSLKNFRPSELMPGYLKYLKFE